MSEKNTPDDVINFVSDWTENRKKYCEGYKLEMWSNNNNNNNTNYYYYCCCYLPD